AWRRGRGWYGGGDGLGAIAGRIGPPRCRHDGIKPLGITTCCRHLVRHPHKWGSGGRGFKSRRPDSDKTKPDKHLRCLAHLESPAHHRRFHRPFERSLTLLQVHARSQRDVQSLDRWCHSNRLPAPPPGSTAYPDTTSRSSGVRALCRCWLNSPRSTTRRSSMLRSAACIAPRRAACSLASDSVSARCSEMKRCSRITAEKSGSHAEERRGSARGRHGVAASLRSRE